ncbi:MAG: DegT/DnrJ/EryC1/StrS family aminotransferase [Thermodesulfobacteriota bacterium]
MIISCQIFIFLKKLTTGKYIIINKIPFIDLSEQYLSLKNDILSKIDEVCRESAFCLGEYVEEFEENFAGYCGVKYCLGVNSGTSALHLALLALGVGDGDEVIIPAQTFIATAWGATYCGAKSVFVDIEPKTHTIDVSKIETAITPKTKAIIPVHLYGQPANMDEILKIARRYNIFVIEDAAQAHGALYKGKKTGSFGEVSCFSFYPGKCLGAFGEGGAVVTNNQEVAEKVSMLRNHGQTKRYYHDVIGFNYRMEGIQGAVLNIKLEYLDDWNEKRRKAASLYNKLLKGTELVLPYEDEYTKPIYHLYVVLSSKRDRIAQHLQQNGIATGMHYPVPLHLQKAYSNLSYNEGDFPFAERNARECLSLPIFPEMTKGQVEYVVTKIRSEIVND